MRLFAQLPHGERSIAADGDVVGSGIAACATFALVTQATSAAAAAANDWATLRGNLDAVLSALQSAAPQTKIVIGTYDNAYRTCNLAVGGAETETLVSQYLEGGGSFTKGLNDVIREVAAAHGVPVAGLYGTLGPDDWAADCDVPSASGQDKVADVFAAAMN